MLTEASVACCCAGFINKIVLRGFKIKGLSFDVLRLIICLFGGCILGQINCSIKLSIAF